VHIGPFGANAAEVLSFRDCHSLCRWSVFLCQQKSYRTALRAISQSPDVAPLMGINLTRIQGFSFALGTALAGIAGGLLLPRLYLFPCW